MTTTTLNYPSSNPCSHPHPFPHPCSHPTGFCVSKDMLRPLSFKVEVIKAIDSTFKVGGICWFVGLFDYYRGLWSKFSHSLYPLTEL